MIPYVPADVVTPSFERLDDDLLAELRSVASVSSTASDVLDDLGWRLCVSGSVLVPRTAGAHSLVGHAVTLDYVPERRMSACHGDDEQFRLAHDAAFEAAGQGDIVVVAVQGDQRISSLGGIASAAAVRAGVGGVIVDGSVRDLDEIRQTGLPVWSRYVTPRTGKWRLEAKSVNRPVCCAGVQVRPGDLVLADETGVAFVPQEACYEVVERVLETARREAAQLEAHSGG